MTSIWIDSRKRVAGTDADFEFDIGETVHLQGSARLGVFKIRVADTFLSTDRGTYLYWQDTALGTHNSAQLPVETGLAAGALEALGGAAATALALEWRSRPSWALQPERAGRFSARRARKPPGSRFAAAAGGALEGARAGASAFPTTCGLGRAGGAAVGGAAALGLGMGAVGGAYEGARYMLGGANGGDAHSSGSDVPDVRTLNGTQQGMHQERFTLRQPMLSRMDVDSDDAPMAQSRRSRGRRCSRGRRGSRGCPSA